MPISAVSLSDVVKKGTPALSAWVSIPEPIVVGHLCQENFSVIVLDLQHGQVDLRAAIASIAMAGLARKPVIARIPVGANEMASQLLDAGAVGIIAPMINTRADAAKLVETTKYPPLGQRSWGASWAVTIGGGTAAEYFAVANRRCLAIPMIETALAVENMDDILGVDGVDGIFVGPTDLSISLANGAGMNPRHPDVDKVLNIAVEKCRVHNKMALAMGGDGARAREMLAMGFDIVALGPDFSHLREGARNTIKTALSIA